MWTDAETQCLIDGVARFGIGSWKKILNHPEYSFQRARNAIDLKDRFRTCFPAVYNGDSQQQDEAPAERTPPDRRAKAAPTTTVELTKMGATEPVTFPKLDRRRRKHFTQDEDERLLRGFIKYGSQWKAIHMDPDLGLQHRTRTDLRDRFRNRYPQRFTEAGFQHKAKQQQAAPPPAQTAAPLPDQGSALVVVAAAAAAAVPLANAWTMDELVSNLVVNPGATLEPAPSGGPSEGSSHAAMRLLAASSFDPFAAFDDFSAGGPLDDGGGAVQLSRTIIDWADQNTRQQLGAGGEGVVPAEVEAGQFGGASTAPLSQILNSRGSFGAPFQ
jgi:hypothetical protein